MNSKLSSLVLLFFIYLNGCSGDGPQEMHYGEDQCSYCRMNVADPAFGTQFISNKGKVYRFDSIECLAAFELTNRGEGTRWVANINKPGTFLSLNEATLVRGESLRSPMGLGLAATESITFADKLIAETNGEIFTWDEVLTYVAESWDIES